jgi:hypothetical protein
MGLSPVVKFDGKFNAFLRHYQTSLPAGKAGTTGLTDGLFFAIIYCSYSIIILLFNKKPKTRSGFYFASGESKQHPSYCLQVAESQGKNSFLFESCACGVVIRALWRKKFSSSIMINIVRV